jgi:hypothetical protein
MATIDPTMEGRFEALLATLFPPPSAMSVGQVHVLGPFDNHDLAGLLQAYPPEQETNLQASYEGKHGRVRWQRADTLDGVAAGVTSLDVWFSAERDVTVYLYGEIVVSEQTIAHLTTECSGLISLWVNGVPVIAPMIPEPANPHDHAAWITLQPGVNRLQVKISFLGREHWVGVYVQSHGTAARAVEQLERYITSATDSGQRLLARMLLTEMHAGMGDAVACRADLDKLSHDPYATRWDRAWAEALQRQYEQTGHFEPFHDPAVQYDPAARQAYPEFWPQSSAPADELLTLDVSDLSPQQEFALSVLQGLVNRKQPRLYLVHTRYARQDRTWLEELHLEGYRSRPVSVQEAWKCFKDEVRGAVIYDGGIMSEIGAFHSAQLNQTNVLMMIGALEDGVPLTPEMNERLGLPVLFDARDKWTDQYDMQRWAYQEMFPRMNQQLLATNYPGIFLITDYLVAFKIFTFWFPEHRTTAEENLLRGILASTPPNSPILGWWFDWMPTVQDPDHRHADAVMEWPGLLRGSYFGKILTPSHEATNLSVHSGVPVGQWRHKTPDRPAYDPSKVYYTFMISDGDNMGEALMMRTRDLHWDKPERGSFPMGWSFAPATSHLAPPVLNYYLRTAAPNDLLMGGLGVGYTEPMIYLRAFPKQREALWAEYARAVDKAMRWIDSTCLWLIDSRHEEADRYAAGSSGQLKGIFIGYGGAPEIAEARVTHHDVVAFYSATGYYEHKTKEEVVQQMVEDIRKATRSRPDFIEAWVLNWGLEMPMLQQVQERLGPDYVCVRPDVLVDLRLQAEMKREE